MFSLWTQTALPDTHQKKEKKGFPRGITAIPERERDGDHVKQMAAAPGGWGHESATQGTDNTVACIHASIKARSLDIDGWDSVSEEGIKEQGNRHKLYVS